MESNRHFFWIGLKDNQGSIFLVLGGKLFLFILKIGASQALVVNTDWSINDR